LLAKCPDQKCENIVSDEIFKRVLDPKLFEKFDKYAFESFVNLSK
jgi:hypothetical protein